MITWLTCGDKDNVFVGVPKTDAWPSRERGLQKGVATLLRLSDERYARLHPYTSSSYTDSSRSKQGLGHLDLSV